MIFKHRLFTILLGLLFETVLTDQASALYDPGVGRFCSRDPMGYADGKVVYAANFILSRSDPSGLLTVELDESSYKPVFCGSQGKAEWKVTGKDNETVVIQKICFDVEVSWYEKTECGCIPSYQAKGVRTQKWKKCYFEILIDAETTGYQETTDFWETPVFPTPSDSTRKWCGQEGSATITSEIRAFTSLQRGSIMASSWKENSDNIDCGDNEIDAGTTLDADPEPSWWAAHTGNAIKTELSATWTCTIDDTENQNSISPRPRR
jgi:uncharacterized protein RhaS with RHS repeats